MQTFWLDDTITYDGSQLRAHWILRACGIAGDALVAFRGPCAVVRDEIADLADVDGPGIAGADMLHFVWERFDDESLTAACLRQRLLTCIAAEAIAELCGVGPRREGDDLFFGDRKLSISIATRTPVSTLIHFALNVSTDGVPVPASSLGDAGVDPRRLARDVLARVEREQQSLDAARHVVRAKGEADR